MFDVKMKRKLTTILLSTILILASWSLGVDGSWFVEECPDCLYGKDIYQIRVFTIPIYQRSEVYNSDFQKMATDIGMPCSLPNLLRWHKHRYWGFLICNCPCINGIERLSGSEDWYDDKARTIVREMTKRGPSLRDRLQVGFSSIMIGNICKHLSNK
jgi:hypothetical protein